MKGWNFFVKMLTVVLIGGSFAFGGCKTEEAVKVKALTPANGQEICIVPPFIQSFLATDSLESSLVEQFSDGSDQFAPIPVKLSWKEVEAAKSYTVKYGTDKEFEKCATYTDYATCSLTIENPFANTEYFWSVTAYGEAGNEIASGVFSFRTEATPRPVDIEGVSNTRDLGGYNVNGGKIAQGLIYRGAKADAITENGKLTVQKLGIKTDLDLRNTGEGTAGGAQSPLGCEKYMRLSSPYYSIFSDEAKASVKTIMQVFATPSNYPIYMHCSLGRDRTGTIAFLLNGLMGAEEKDLLLDYFFSAFSSAGRGDTASCETLKRNFYVMYDGINRDYEGEIYAEKVESYLRSTGLSVEEISTIEQILLVE